MKTHLIYKWLDQSVSVCNILKYIPEEYKNEEISILALAPSTHKPNDLYYGLFWRQPNYLKTKCKRSACLWLTGQVWMFRWCGWLCRGGCPPHCPSSRAHLARTACTGAGCRCARGTEASAWPCWRQHRCAWWGKWSKAPGGRAKQSCLWSPRKNQSHYHHSSLTLRYW